MRRPADSDGAPPRLRLGRVGANQGHAPLRPAANHAPGRARLRGPGIGSQGESFFIFLKCLYKYL